MSLDILSALAASGPEIIRRARVVAHGPAAGVLRQNVRMQGTPNFRCLQFDVGMGQHPYGGQTVQPAKGTIVALLVGFFFSLLKIKSNALHLATQVLYTEVHLTPF